MGWTEERTWVDDEVVTAAMLNEQLRDNQAILKVSRNSLGRISALDSTTVADLASGGLTGLAKAGVGNAFTAGTTRFGSDARFVFPVGADKWTGTKGVDAGGVWVEGDYLHHIGSNHTTEYRYLGTYVSHPAGAKVGSGWIEGDDLHYIDADGDERKVQFLGPTTAHTDAAAVGGSLWGETYTHWIRESGSVEKVGHADITHADHSDHQDHDDHQDYGGPHQDSGHADHDDTTHADHSDHQDHNDYIYVDYDDHEDYAPPHEDTPHVDHYDHGDYTDHTDNTPHQDVAADQRPEAV